MSATKSFFRWTLQLILLFVLFVVFFNIGSVAVLDLVRDNVTSDPGWVPATTVLLVIVLADLLVIAMLILTSRWSGWKLAVSLALAHYGAVTFLMQIETSYFLSSTTITSQLLRRLFLMGIPTSFLFIPLAVWILGKGRAIADTSPNLALVMPTKQWIWKLAAIAVVYLVLYWVGGYFVAWYNPDDLRVFYGQPGDALPFLAHTANTLRNDPMLFPFQILRGLLWTLCALPIIRGSKVNPWWTALMVGLLFSVPQNLAYIINSPFKPISSVRLSYMMETASSTFIFGTIVVWLLHREHHSFGDLVTKFTKSARANIGK
jgi:hypothetical protein